jgi:hypothetical protein
MLRLADTSIKLYRKKNGKASLCLRSYLMVTTNVNYRLSAYLDQITCRLTLSSGAVIVFDEIGISDDLICKCEIETMVHNFWASAIADMQTIKNRVGTLRIDYHLNFTAHPSETSEYFELVVPLVKRTSRYMPAPVIHQLNRQGEG